MNLRIINAVARSGACALLLAAVVPPAAGQTATSTTLVVSVPQCTIGQLVTLTATVFATTGTPTGNVLFFDGSTLVDTGLLTTARTATIKATFSPSGIHNLSAVYPGDLDFAPSTSASVDLTVLYGFRSGSSTSLSSSLNPSTDSQQVVLTAAVTSGAGIPTGSITFYDDTARILTVPLDAGTAVLPITSLSAGVHPLTAQYSGDDYFLPSVSPVVSQTVTSTGKPATATVLNSSLNPSAAGQAVTFTATVSAAAGNPTGSVDFQDGGVSIGTVLLGGGVASLTSSTLSAGSHSLKAVYSGDRAFAGSTSAPLTQGVTLPPPVPAFQQSAVVNSASFAPGLAPGAYSTVFGTRLSGGITATGGMPYPINLQGVQVLFAGRAVPLVYVSDGQINFLVPPDAQPGSSNLVISTPSGSSTPVPVTVSAALPGIFYDPTSGYGAILIAGTAQTTLTRPAQAGQYLEIYCTGLGATGASNLTLWPVSVNLGSMTLVPSYSGLNPVYPGLYQVNIQVPAGLSGEQWLSLQIEGQTSNKVKVRLQ